MLNQTDTQLDQTIEGIANNCQRLDRVPFALILKGYLTARRNGVETEFVGLMAQFLEERGLNVPENFRSRYEVK